MRCVVGRGRTWVFGVILNIGVEYKNKKNQSAAAKGVTMNHKVQGGQFMTS